MVRFSDCFWDTEFNGTNGYDTLLRRLKDGKKVCDDFIEFVRLRAKAEDEYGKSLIKISQNAGGNEEIGTMRAAWDTVKRETENIGTAHCSAAQKLTEEIEKNVKDFRERQKLERVKIDEKMKRLQKEKKSCYENMIKTKRNYEQKCKESDAAKDALETKSILTPKEEEKLRIRVSKAKTSAETSDATYQHAVTTLEDMRLRWEKDTEHSCNLFQVLEEDRIKFLRNAMWIYSNVGSMSAVTVDLNNEKMRMSLENCDEVADIQLFIKMKQTGSARPASIGYENYYNPSHNVSFNQQPQNDVILRRPSDDRPPLPSHATHGQGKIVNASYSHTSNLVQQKALNTQDSEYSSIQELQVKPGAPPDPLPKMVRAAYDYDAQGDVELSLKRGDVIQVLKYEDEVWGYGLLGNGNRGVFPLAFVEYA